MYIEVSTVHDLNNMLKEGYEFVCAGTRSHFNTVSQYANLNGTFMGNQINLNGNVGDTGHVITNTFYLMKLTKTGNLLYGES